MIDEKCVKCKYKGNCLYENSEAYGIRASECCDVDKEKE